MTSDGSTEPTTGGDDDGSREEPLKRTLVGHFAADADVDEIVDMIIATVPPDQRPAEDRPERLPKPL